MKTAKVISETIVVKAICPHCSEVNIISWDADMTDSSKMDVEGMKCHSCGGESMFPSVDEFYDMEFPSNFYDGKKSFSL